MADPVIDTGRGSSEEAFGYFSTVGIPQLVSVLGRVQRLAGAAGNRSAQAAVLGVVGGLLKDVNDAAVEMAGIADGLIVTKMLQTQARNRPLTGAMETHVRSVPGPLGTVRVALIAELDKIVNPRGYGPFWRAQEYGTGSPEVASQVGRPLFGTFEPSGGPPDSAQQGVGAGHDLAFIPMGSAPGFGRISVELPGRHFLRDGTAEAGARYVVKMSAVQQRWIARMEELKAQARVGRGANIIGILRA